MSEFQRAQVGVGAQTLPGRYYASEEVFAAERERIFAREWVCVGRAAAIEAPGDFVAVTVAGESLLLVRDGGEPRSGCGVARAFYNVCRHRGTRLCEAAQGRFGKSIQCPYHAWTYGLDGQLIAARNMQEVPGFERRDYPLHAAAIAEWEGFLFVSLAREPEPFAEVFAPVMDRFRSWAIGSLRPGHRIEYEVAANWKLVVENYSECYHCPLVHPALARLSPPESGRNDLLAGRFLGGYMTLNHPEGSMTLTGGTARPAVGQVAGEDRSRVYYYALFPNLLLSLHPDYVMAHFLQPENLGQTRIVCEWYFDPATMARPGFDPGDAVEFWDLTNRQDWHVCELSQLGVGSRAYSPGPYANAEGLLWAFDRQYLQAMNGESSQESGVSGQEPAWTGLTPDR